MAQVQNTQAFGELEQRLADGQVMLLDGAVGTELQALGVPIGQTAWAAVALHSHPETVRFLHDSYLRAGVDILTTNTYSAARHCLEPLGMGDLTRELNLRAVYLALEARDRSASGRPIAIAGSVSNFGIMTGSEPLPDKFAGRWSDYSEAAVRRNLHEQAQILADGGVDLLLVESTGTVRHRQWVTEACLATGLPTWIGFKCRLQEGDVMSGYREEVPFAQSLDQTLSLGGDGVSLFHSTVEATTAGLPVIREKWSGPIAVYPDADRTDYVDRHQDQSQTTRTSPAEFLGLAQGWVAAGAQVIGGCCGFGLDYIRPLRAALPERIPQ